MSEAEAKIHIDGGSRGNPGPASYAFVLRRPGEEEIEECDRLGSATNNIAEYTALVRALQMAHELGLQHVAIFSDSELLVKQMNGEYRVKNADLRELYEEATELRSKFAKVTLTHVRREYNKDADRLCNEALDGNPRPRGASRPPREIVSPLAILENAGKLWLERGRLEPTPSDVLAELTSALEKIKPQ